jgi:murein DD-endopeptidase MepM/ murein hydrolase activator NlpD
MNLPNLGTLATFWGSASLQPMENALRNSASSRLTVDLAEPSHAGWNLYAKLGTRAFAVADGNVVYTGVMHGYGNVLLLEFQFRERTL